MKCLLPCCTYYDSTTGNARSLGRNVKPAHCSLCVHSQQERNRSIKLLTFKSILGDVLCWSIDYGTMSVLLCIVLDYHKCTVLVLRASHPCLHGYLMGVRSRPTTVVLWECDKAWKLLSGNNSPCMASPAGQSNQRSSGLIHEEAHLGLS